MGIQASRILEFCHGRSPSDNSPQSASTSSTASDMPPARQRAGRNLGKSSSRREDAVSKQGTPIQLDRQPQLEPCPVCNEQFADESSFQLHFETHFPNDKPIDGMVTCSEPTCSAILRPEDIASHHDYHFAEKLDNDEILKRKRDEDRTLKELRREYLGPFADDEPDRKKLRTRTSKVVSDEEDTDAKPQVIQSMNSLPNTSSPLNTSHSDILPILYRHLQISHRAGATTEAYLCSPSADQIRFGRADWGWACGYRNCQILLSYLVNTRQAESVLSAVPDIRTLQHVIHKAWEEGYDRQGFEQLKQVVDTRKWIGTSEVSVIMSALGIPSRIYDFSGNKNSSTLSDAILDFVERYFSQVDLQPTAAASPESSVSSAHNSNDSLQVSQTSSISSPHPDEEIEAKLKAAPLASGSTPSSALLSIPSPKGKPPPKGPKSAFDVLLGKRGAPVKIVAQRSSPRLHQNSNSTRIASPLRTAARTLAKLSHSSKTTSPSPSSTPTPQIVFPQNDPTLTLHTPSIVMTDLPPLYFQHSGHSRTIVGIEKLSDGTRNLLVFDPSKIPTRTIMKQAKEWRQGIDFSEVGSDSDATASDSTKLPRNAKGKSKPTDNGRSVVKEQKNAKAALRHYRVVPRDILRHSEYQILKVVTEVDESSPSGNAVPLMTPEQQHACKIIRSVRLL